MRALLLLGAAILAAAGTPALSDDAAEVLDLLTNPQPLPDRVILITGRQYAWDIDYVSASDDARCKVTGTLAIPQNEKVELVVTADDIIHELAIPDLGIEVDGIPGRLNSVMPDTSKTGNYKGGATALSGSGYQVMTIEIAILDKAEFDAWMQKNLPACVTK